MHNIQYDLILLAAGRGRRIGGRNKGLLKICGKSFVEYELDKFCQIKAPSKIIITYHPNYLTDLKKAISDHQLKDQISFVMGGKERVFSVYNALSALRDSDSQLVLIHDVARPNFSAELIMRGLKTALTSGSAIPAIPLTDTIKYVQEEKIVKTIPRENIYQVQTPQFFDRRLIIYAYDKWLKEKDRFFPTDDASLIENIGLSPTIFSGERTNIKITYREDMDMIYNNRSFRIGFGYDIHRIKKGGHLYLGGVAVDKTRSAIAHSDGDVLLHALCDALLGASGLRDIGYYFPDQDKQYKGISSLKILEKTYNIISSKGFEVINIDSTIILESPKIGKYLENMKKNIASILKTEELQIGIKATTAERTGKEGRGKAFSAYCVVLLRG